jgi:hypothetical protein
MPPMPSKEDLEAAAAQSPSRETTPKAASSATGAERSLRGDVAKPADNPADKPWQKKASGGLRSRSPSPSSLGGGDSDGEKVRTTANTRMTKKMMVGGAAVALLAFRFFEFSNYCSQPRKHFRFPL